MLFRKILEKKNFFGNTPQKRNTLNSLTMVLAKHPNKVLFVN